jgi:hypothetical protein
LAFVVVREQRVLDFVVAVHCVLVAFGEDEDGVVNRCFAVEGLVTGLQTEQAV